MGERLSELILFLFLFKSLVLYPTANLLIRFTHSACSSNSLMGTKYQWRQILWQSSSSAEISDANVRWHLFSFFAQKISSQKQKKTLSKYDSCALSKLQPGNRKLLFPRRSNDCYIYPGTTCWFLARRSDVTGEMSVISNNGCGRGCSGKQDGMREEKLGRTYVCTETGKRGVKCGANGGDWRIR